MNSKINQVIVGSGTNSYYVQTRSTIGGEHFYKYIKADLTDSQMAVNIAVNLAKEKNVPLVNRILSTMSQGTKERDLKILNNISEKETDTFWFRAD